MFSKKERKIFKIFLVFIFLVLIVNLKSMVDNNTIKENKIYFEKEGFLICTTFNLFGNIQKIVSKENGWHLKYKFIIKNDNVYKLKFCEKLK